MTTQCTGLTRDGQPCPNPVATNRKNICNSCYAKQRRGQSTMNIETEQFDPLMARLKAAEQQNRILKRIIRLEQQNEQLREQLGEQPNNEQRAEQEAEQLERTVEVNRELKQSVEQSETNTTDEQQNEQLCEQLGEQPNNEQRAEQFETNTTDEQELETTTSNTFPPMEETLEDEQPDLGDAPVMLGPKNPLTSPSIVMRRMASRKQRKPVVEAPEPDEFEKEGLVYDKSMGKAIQQRRWREEHPVPSTKTGTDS